MSVLHLITQKPQLLLEHVDAYSDLLTQEMGSASRAWTYRAAMGMVALLLFCGAGLLAGVGFMLWSVMPSAQMQAPWALWVTPIVPLCLALICAWMLKSHMQHRVFSDIRQQIKEDLALLREMNGAA